MATLIVRPRGWHLEEAPVCRRRCGIRRAVRFRAVLFHNARELIDQNGSYFYLPKMESHLEARLWNDVFNFAQDELGIPGLSSDRPDRDDHGAFEMDGFSQLRSTRRD